MSARTKRVLLGVLLALLLVALAAWEARRQQDAGPPLPAPDGPVTAPEGRPAPDTPPAQLLPNRNVRYGLPGPASTDPADQDRFLIDRPQFVLSYNDSKRLANWVCWQLVAADVGKADRGPFGPDPLLPKGFGKVTTGVYTGSGFDRGHLCPSKDRSDAEANNDPTFFLTNIAPQAPDLNQRAWERLERYCRDLAAAGSVLYICAGPLGAGGTGRNGPREEIGKGKTKVVVPGEFWKVVMVLPGAETLPRPDTRVIAVRVPNQQGVGEDWTQYRVSAREIEQATGYRFFPAVPPAVADTILSRVDDAPVRLPTGR